MGSLDRGFELTNSRLGISECLGLGLGTKMLRLGTGFSRGACLGFGLKRLSDGRVVSHFLAGVGIKARQPVEPCNLVASGPTRAGVDPAKSSPDRRA